METSMSTKSRIENGIRTHGLQQSKKIIINYFKYILIYQGMLHLHWLMDIHYLETKVWNSHHTYSFMDSLDALMYKETRRNFLGNAI